MKTAFKELKRIARANLIDNYNIAMRALTTMMLITLAIELPFSVLLRSEHPTPMQNILYYIVELLISIISGVLQIGLIQLHLSLARGQKIAHNQVFHCFRTQTDRYIISIVAKLLLYVVSASPAILGMYLFETNTERNLRICAIILCIISVVCMIFVSLSFYFVSYVLLDHADISVIKGFQQSYRFMKGQRLRLLFLFISFIGMGILEILSVGIGAFWIEPYKSQTIANFYLDITGESAPSYFPFQAYI